MQTLTQLPNPEELGKHLKENCKKKEIEFKGIHIDNRINGDPKYTKVTKFSVIARLLTKKDTKQDKYLKYISLSEDKILIDIHHVNRLNDYQATTIQKEFTFNLYEADKDKGFIDVKQKKTDVDIDNEIRIKLGQDADKFDIAQEVDHSLTPEEQMSELKPKLDIIAGKGLEEQAEEVKSQKEKFDNEKFVVNKLNSDLESFCEDFPFINKRFYSALENLREDDYGEEEIKSIKLEFETHKKTRNAFESLLNIGFDLDDLTDISICVLEVFR